RYPSPTDPVGLSFGSSWSIKAGIRARRGILRIIFLLWPCLGKGSTSSLRWNFAQQGSNSRQGRQEKQSSDIIMLNPQVAVGNPDLAPPFESGHYSQGVTVLQLLSLVTQYVSEMENKRCLVRFRHLSIS
ncbi:MAG: hypothetical protein WBB79_00865, partial [Candidatus Macondimonas sp.]